MERVQIEPTGVVVDQLFDQAHGLEGRVQSKDHRTHARHAAGQVQLDHLRIHFVPQVAIVVDRVSVVGTLEEHMHFGRAAQDRRLRSQADRREVQTDQCNRVLEPVDLDDPLLLVAEVDVVSGETIVDVDDMDSRR